MVKLLDPAADVTCLLFAGSDPHHSQLTPHQIERIGTSTLLVRSSRDDSGWLNLKTETTTIDLWPKRDHAWLDPQIVAKMLPELAGALADANPEHRRQIGKNLEKALVRVMEINHAISTAFGKIKQRGVIMQHPSWRRVFDSYGIPILAVLESERHGHESGPRHLEAALTTLKQHPDAILIGDLRHGDRSLQWLSKQSGIAILYLDGLGECGETWEELMLRNIRRLEEK